MKTALLKSISMLLWGATAYLAGYEIFITRTLVSNVVLIALNHFAIQVSVLEKIGATGIGNIASLMMAMVAIKFPREVRFLSNKREMIISAMAINIGKYPYKTLSIKLNFPCIPCSPAQKP